MDTSYWTKALNFQIKRRRLLATAGGSAAAAALLAACGGGSSSRGSSGSQADKSSLVAKPVEVPPAQARRGGTLRVRHTGDPATLDPAGAVNPLNPPARLAYNTLVRMAYGTLKPSDNAIVPDVAESWEIAPDGTQITMKIRQGVKWHNKAPVN